MPYVRNSSADRQLVIMAEPTFEAHELVYCAKCFLPYDQNVNITEVAIPQDSQTRSWYLTNCGHTLCSKCLFPNESTPPIPFFFPPLVRLRLPTCSLSTVIAPTTEPDVRFPCPKCQHSATVVPLGAEVPSPRSYPLSTVRVI